MSVGEYCNREVVITKKDTNICEAAKLMRKHHVGDLVVVELRGEENIPIGIVTDRDLVVEVLAQDVPLEAVTVGDVMSTDLATLREADGLWETLTQMRSRGIRRMPVVNDRGGLEGILAVDDVLELLAEGLTDLVGLVKRELKKEARSRP